MRILLVSFVFAFFTSCTKTDIDAGPTIIEVKTASEHGEGLHGYAGSTNRFYVSTSDDKALKEIQLTITAPDEFHSHVTHGGGLIPAFKAPNQGTWEATKTFQLTGTDTTVIFKFITPPEVSGAWNVTTKVLDTAGNLSERNETVVIANDSIPAIIPTSTLPEANADGIVEINSGETFSAQGKILDVNYLQTITVSIFSQTEKLWEQVWSPENEWQFQLSQITFPVFTTTGEYKIIISATDRNDWKNWVQADLIVK